MRKKYNKRKDNPKIQSNAQPNQNVITSTKGTWRERDVTHPTKGIYMGNGPLPSVIRSCTLAKFHKPSWLITHYQDTMRSGERSVRIDQRKKKNEKCWNDGKKDKLTLLTEHLELLMMKEYLRKGIIFRINQVIIFNSISKINENKLNYYLKTIIYKIN